MNNFSLSNKLFMQSRVKFVSSNAKDFDELIYFYRFSFTQVSSRSRSVRQGFLREGWTDLVYFSYFLPFTRLQRNKIALSHQKSVRNVTKAAAFTYYLYYFYCHNCGYFALLQLLTSSKYWKFTYMPGSKRVKLKST